MNRGTEERGEQGNRLGLGDYAFDRDVFHPIQPVAPAAYVVASVA